MSITAKDVCYARKQPLSNHIPPTVMSTKHSISEFWLSLGGDWKFIARLLGLTGPNGTFFCNFCHAQLKDLEKGKPYTPWLLEQGATASHTYQKVSSAQFRVNVVQ